MRHHLTPKFVIPTVPISQTPGVGVYNNSPRALGVPKPPPEAFVDMPYMVSMVDAPFIVSDAPEQGANRFGSLSRESGEENYNGRMGKLCFRTFSQCQLYWS